MVLVTHKQEHLGRCQTDFWLMIHSKDFVRFTMVFEFRSGSFWHCALMSQSSKYWWSAIPLERVLSFTPLTFIVKTCGPVTSPRAERCTGKFGNF